MGEHGLGETARNRLAASLSPYLLLHKDDPVHWQPWDDAAFALAERLDRPILLSIGYSACHWCHVMARESFRDPETAAVMNALFVSVKVDREERPDLDRFYLAAMARLGRPTGWPVTAFLLPGGEPFAGGGYFPPEPRFGLPAFRTALRAAAAQYRQAPGQAAANERAATRSTPGPLQKAGTGEISRALLDRVARQLAEGVDALYGGFGMQGPKFLQPAGHELLLRAWQRTGDRSYLDTAAGSVAAMGRGAIFDHVGGGFHRYAVDDRWRVPHFEKMLGDNAQMVALLTRLWQATGGTVFAARVEATVAWLLREMQLSDGTFAASLSADSPGREGRPEGEGAFYLWDPAEISSALGARSGAFLAAFETVTDDALHGGHALIRRAEDGDLAEDERYAAEVAALRRQRDARDRPARDDKVLADWNGLTVAALVEAGLAFDRPDWVEAGRAAFASVVRVLAPGNRVAHSAVAGQRTADGFLDDYAALAQAALALHEATGDPALIAQARAWVQVLDALFWDDEAGGYFLVSAEGEQRIPRQKFVDETATPAGNGTMLGVLARLYILCGQEHYWHRFDGVLRCFAARLSRAHLHAATALNQSRAMDALVQVVVVGDREAVQQLRSEAARPYIADRLLIPVPSGATLPEEHPAHGKAPPADAAAAAFVCSGPLCRPPATDPAALRKILAHAVRGDTLV